MTKAKCIKRSLLLSGMMSTAAVWGVAFYWTLVSNGHLVSPWAA